MKVMKSRTDAGTSTGAEVERRYWMAMAAYAILAGLAWWTIGDGAVLIQGKPLEVRWVPVAVMGVFALRTALARQADRIRREKQG